jgi:hypothetical protein
LFTIESNTFHLIKAGLLSQKISDARNINCNFLSEKTLHNSTPMISCVITTLAQAATLILVKAAYYTNEQLLVRIGLRQNSSIFGNFIPIQNTVAISSSHS